MAVVAPIKAVTAPVHAITYIATGMCSNTGYIRAIRNTPAATIVAAWINAEIGVGPSIASGSHTCKGTCADFATGPMNTNTAKNAATAPLRAPV